jgi:tryptophan 2,3-dioxygenase
LQEVTEVLCCLQLHPQSIYYSLRTFVLGLRENAQRALQEFTRHRAAVEQSLQMALEAANGNEDGRPEK